MNIPWMIYSDAEEDAKRSVQTALRKIDKESEISDRVIFLEDGNDFEREILSNGYDEEVRNAIAFFDEYKNEHHRQAKESQRLKDIKGFSLEELYKQITSEKTRYGPAVANQIVNSQKQLPTKVVALMEKIEHILVQRR